MIINPTRRQLLSGAAATAVTLGVSTSIASASASLFGGSSGISSAHSAACRSTCSAAHSRLQQVLTDIAADPVVSKEALNLAMKTWHCPTCKGRITSSFASAVLAT